MKEVLFLEICCGNAKSVGITQFVRIQFSQKFFLLFFNSQQIPNEQILPFIKEKKFKTFFKRTTSLLNIHPNPVNFYTFAFYVKQNVSKISKGIGKSEKEIWKIVLQNLRMCISFKFEHFVSPDWSRYSFYPMFYNYGADLSCIVTDRYFAPLR